MMDSLPIELLDIIASTAPSVYYALLGYKFFVDTLNYGKRVDFMILFGHSIEITGEQILWYYKGEKHRVNGPAYENANGDKEWYQNGKRHLIDGPALEWDGITVWYYKGEKHRVGGPAVERWDGSTEWFYEGELHRIDGPAIEAPEREDAYGTKQWYINGKLHRDNDLPAIEYNNGIKEWWINGEYIRTGL